MLITYNCRDYIPKLITLLTYVNTEVCQFDKLFLLPSLNSDCVHCLFQSLLTSLAANRSRLVSINSLADEIIQSGSSQKDKVASRRRQIVDR